MWGAARGVVAASLVTFLVFSFFEVHVAAVPRTVWIIDGLLTLAFVAGSRMLARTIIERPQGRSIVARGKEVIVVGAGDAAQLILKEMLRTPDSRLHAHRPDRRRPAQEEPAPARHPRARDDRRAAAHPPRPPSGRAPDRDPVRVRRSAPADRRHRERAGHRDEDAAGPARADRRRSRPRGPDPPRRGRRRPRTRAGRGGHRRDRGLPVGRDRARHGRRRLDRRRAVPPDLARRPGAPRARRSLRAGAVRDRAGARGRARLPGCAARARGREEPGQDAPGLRGLPSLRRLPRRGLQARAADRVEPRRGGAQQHARARAPSPRSRSSSAPTASSSSRPTRPSTRRP